MRVSQKPCGMMLFICALLACPASGLTDGLEQLAEKLASGEEPADADYIIGRLLNIADPRVENVLLRLADSPSARVRAAACRVLWQAGGAATGPKLQEKLLDADAEVRLEAAYSLFRLGQRDRLNNVIEGLKSEQTPVRIRALRALAEVNVPAVRQAVEAFSPKTSSEEEIWRAYALVRLGVGANKNRKFLADSAQNFTRLEWLMKLSDPSEADLQKAAAAGPETPLKLSACRALAELGDAQSWNALALAAADPALEEFTISPAVLLRRWPADSLPALVNCLADERAAVVLGCVRVLKSIAGYQRQDKLLPMLLRLIKGPARLVRLEAIEALGAFSSSEAAEGLVALLAHPDRQTRFRAARALGSMGQAAAASALMERLKDEENASVRRQIYRSLKKLAAPSTLDPLLQRLRLLLAESGQNKRMLAELYYCQKALAGFGDRVVERLRPELSAAKGRWRRLLEEILAASGSELLLDKFLRELREDPPQPEAPAVRYFGSLKPELAPRLEKIIREETAMWVRMVLARTLYKMGRREYARGLVWGLQQADGYLNRLAAALSSGIRLPEIRPLLAGLLEGDDRETARYAARALFYDGSPQALSSLTASLRSPALRERPQLPLRPFWDGPRTALHPYTKEIENERVWVLFAEDRLGRPMDLFLTWSVDGRVWHPPVFTGLTSFSDRESQVPPPTFSLKVEGRDITVALTRTFAETVNPVSPRFNTEQRVHKFKLQQLFQDADRDGLSDLAERAIFTSAQSADSDGDGLADNLDKNPLAAPARPDNQAELIKVLAYAQAAFFSDEFRPRGRLLVVRPGGERVPELPWFPHLVLHLSQTQFMELWKNSGAGFPYLVFDSTRFSADGNSAVQTLRLLEVTGEEIVMKFTFGKEGGQWVKKSRSLGE